MGIPTAAVAVADAIRTAILDGTVGAGERLKEDEIARELEISRTPVREGLLLLQAEGLVQSLPRRGAVVRSYGVGELDDMYQLRALLEGWAARRAASRIGDDAVGELKRSCERFRALCHQREVEIRELVQENMLFHEGIHEAADSARLVEMVRTTIQLPLVYKSYIWYSPKQKLLSEHYHNELAHVLAEGDAERAELIMKEHVFEARDHLVATVRAEDAARAHS